MNPQDETRDRVTEQRQHDEHQQDTLHTRAESQLQQDSPPDTELAETAREELAQERQHEEHLKDTLHSRATENLQTNA